MPDEDKNFGGSLVLDFGKWWRHVKTIYNMQTLKFKVQSTNYAFFTTMNQMFRSSPQPLSLTTPSAR